ncbi:MAG TPA: CHASE2 domain-containing protein, partial [Limnochordia bacterium]
MNARAPRRLVRWRRRRARRSPWARPARVPRPLQGVAAGLGVAALIGLLSWSGLFAWPERAALDRFQEMRVRLGHSMGSAADPLVIAVDEPALDAIGAWPWPRETLARLIDRLGEAGAGAIGLAIRLPNPAADPISDIALAEAMRRAGRVVVAAEPVVVTLGDAREPGIRFASPIPLLAGAARALGHITLSADSDGTLRRVALYTAPPAAEGASVPAPQVPALALSLARVQAESAGVSLSPAMPFERGASVLLSLRPTARPGPEGLATTLSAAEFLREGPDASLPQLGGRPVLIGVTAPDVPDVPHYRLPLPGLERVPAVYIHAAAARQIL